MDSQKLLPQLLFAIKSQMDEKVHVCTKGRRGFQILQLQVLSLSILNFFCVIMLEKKNHEWVVAQVGNDHSSLPFLAGHLGARSQRAPQWVQSKTLVGAQGAKLQKALTIYHFILTNGSQNHLLNHFVYAQSC